MTWLTRLGEIAGREPVAMISVLATEGSAPRGAGTRMLVTAAASHDTIGGGQLEFRAVEQARLILHRPAGCWRVQDYPLGPLLGQCCGGRVRVLIEHVDAADLDWLAAAGEGRALVSTLTAARVERQTGDGIAASSPSTRGDLAVGTRFVEVIGRHRRPVYLFGAGHVGQAIARHAASLPFQLAWFDPRPDFGALDGVALVPEAALTQCVAEAPDEAAIVVLTHDHALDYALVRAALDRDRTAFVGLIGSATKRARFDARLAHDGIAPAVRARLICPIGIGGVVGKEPDVIAVATLAQLLQLPR